MLQKETEIPFTINFEGKLYNCSRIVKKVGSGYLSQRIEVFGIGQETEGIDHPLHQQDVMPLMAETMARNILKKLKGE
jgi:hypothetical protein